MSYCSYMNCDNRTHPLTSVPFFSLPTDYRRGIWIKNSGNPELLKITPSTIKKFCENHFHPKFFKRQFNRTLLTKDAIPNPFEGLLFCLCFSILKKLKINFCYSRNSRRRTIRAN